jgi:trehalose-6-phosphatase
VIDADATVAALTVRSDRTALLLDFDGSLAPIVARAEDARPLRDAPGLLGRLAA